MRDAHRRPLAVWTLVASLGFAAGCGGEEPTASTAAAADTQAAGAKPTEAGATPTEKTGDKTEKAGDKPEKRSSKDRPSKSGASGDDTTPASSGGKIGIAACDDYLKTVQECGNKAQIDMVERTLAKKWREALADGKSESDVQPLCEKAAGLFKCRK